MAKQILDLAARRVVGRGKGLQGEHGENQRGQPARTTPARWHRARAMFKGQKCQQEYSHTTRLPISSPGVTCAGLLGTPSPNRANGLRLQG